MATETLSGYLEGEAVRDKVETLKQEVLDKTKYCNSRREKILAHVYEVGTVQRGYVEWPIVFGVLQSHLFVFFPSTPT